jgi:prepilin-type N-terminal cleavage/methylation domain-containing protein
MRTHNGFTLIELMIVVSILGLLVLFAAPKIDTTRFKVDAAVRAMGTTLITAQRQAITQQHDIIVQFDEAAQSIRIHDDRNNNTGVDAGERVRGIPLGEHIVFGLAGAPPRPMGAGPVTFTKLVRGLPAVVFHRDGSASQAGGFYLTFATGTRPDATRSVEIERATGRALWYRYAPPTWRKVF